MKKFIFVLLFASKLFAQSWIIQPPVGVLPNLVRPGAQGLKGLWIFNEGSGLTVFDLSGNRNDGTLINMDQSNWVVGRDGWALDFDGTDDVIDVSSFASSINGATSVTIHMWVKSNSISVNKGLLTPINSDVGDSGLSLRYDSAGFQGGQTNVIKAGFGTAAGDEDNNSAIESSGFVQTLEWQFIVVTWKANEAPKIYLDGVLDIPSFTSSNGSVISGVTDARIAQSSVTDTEKWDGLISMALIFNRALTASEIMARYINPYAMFDQPRRFTAAVASARNRFITIW